MRSSSTAAEKDKGGIIAAANLLSFVGIALSSGVYFVFTAYIHLDPRGVIVAAPDYRAGNGLCADAAAGVVRAPDSLLRDAHRLSRAR
jgi:hypothetical protein